MVPVCTVYAVYAVYAVCIPPTMVCKLHCKLMGTGNRNPQNPNNRSRLMKTQQRVQCTNFHNPLSFAYSARNRGGYIPLPPPHHTHPRSVIREKETPSVRCVETTSRNRAYHHHPNGEYDVPIRGKFILLDLFCPEETQQNKTHPTIGLVAQTNCTLLYPRNPAKLPVFRENPRNSAVGVAFSAKRWVHYRVW